MKRLLVSLLVCLMTVTVPLVFAQRAAPPATPHSAVANTPGYCNSYGGSTLYESISNVTWTISGNTISFVVDVYIANPTGCTPGNPCPEYDGSPEYLNGWMDWNGNNVWEPGEQVIDLAMSGYLNINYHGVMTGYAQATIPANHVAQTYLRVNLGWGGDPNDPCLQSWAWGNVVDYAIALPTSPGHYEVTEMDVVGGNPIREIPDDVVYRDGFLEVFGLCIDNPIDQTPIEQYPISAPRSQEFWLATTISRCPTDPEALPPTLRCEWTWMSGAISDVYTGGPSWDHFIPISAPPLVGINELDMEFTITESGTGQETHQSIHRRMYTTFGNAQTQFYASGYPAFTATPKRIWYDRACRMADGGSTEQNTVQTLLNGIYYWGQGHWRYGYYFVPFVTKCNWQDLVEGSWCNFSDCYVFSDVLDNMSSVLGITGYTPITVSGANCGCCMFVTNGAPSLDHAFTGNAKPDAGSYDRYVFGSHSLRLRNGEYYDATFNGTYAAFDQFIQWRMTTCGTSQLSGDGMIVDRLGGDAYDHWGNYRYRPASLFASDPPSDGTVQLSTLTFTGAPVFSLLDPDGDGIYEALGVDVAATLDAPDTVTVVGQLLKNGTLISQRPQYFFSGVSSFDYEGSPSQFTAHLEFSGEDILQSGEDGPYTLSLEAIDPVGPIGSTTMTTPAYIHSQFGELGSSVTSAADLGVDTDGDGQFDLLRVSVTISTRSPGPYLIDGTLMKDTVTLGVASVGSVYSAGQHTVDLNFKGTSIRGRGLNGPYQAVIILKDSTGSSVGSLLHVTQPYQAADFDLAVVHPTGEHNDFGMDNNGNGLFDSLRVQIGMQADSAGTYEIAGWLAEPAGIVASVGEVFAFAHATVDLSVGTHTVNLDFPGTAIQEHGVNGPFVLKFLEVKGADFQTILYIQPEYPTAAYQSTQFEGAAATVHYTGNHTDQAVDNNGNGLYDELIVNMEATFASDAVILGFAELRDADGRTIAQGSGFSHVDANVATMIPIHFNGQYIFGNLRNGPFSIHNAFLYPSIDINLGTHVPDVGMTGAYNYEDFERAAVITGIARSTTSGQFATGAGISSSEASDFVDANGYYRLIYLTGGNKHIEISMPAFPTAEWDVYHNGNHLGHQTWGDIAVQLGQIDSVDFLTDNPLNGTHHDLCNADSSVHYKANTLLAPMVTAHFADSNIVLNWTRVPAADFYRVYRSVTFGGDFESVGFSLDTLWTDTTVAASTDRIRYYYVMAFMTSTTPTITADSVKAYWPMEEGTGTATECVDNPDYVGTLHNADWVHYASGGDSCWAIGFTDNKWVSVSNDAVFYQAPMQIDVRMRVNQIQPVNLEMIVNNTRYAPTNGGFMWYVDRYGKLTAVTWDGLGWRSMTGAVSVPVGQWFNASLVINGDQSFILLNGTVVAAGNLPFNHLNNSMPFTFGAQSLPNGGHEQFLFGDIAWARITTP
jgi:hypothetical protein